MAENTGNPRVGWLRYAMGAVVGLLIGLLIGWWLWPVEWRNALPSDLRPAEREAYLQMTAESFAQNKDLRTAQERLVTWPQDQLAKELATLQGRLAGANLQGAAQVQNLMAALNLQTTQPASPTAKPGAAPTAAAPTAAPSDLMTQLRRICTLGLWVLLILGGVAAFVVLYRRWRASQAAQGGPAIDESLIRERPIARTSQPIAEDARRARAGAQWEEPQPPLPVMEWTEPAVEKIEPETAEGELPPFLSSDEAARRSQARTPESKPPPVVAPSAPASRPAEPIRRGPASGPIPQAGQLVKLGEWRPAYQMGEPDYSEAFDINNVDGSYLGQCAMDLMDPVGRQHDQAAALQVSLWDSNDPDTRVVVLMSEGAYRDTAMRDQLAGAGQPVIVAKPGAEFTLETYKLLLRGTVDQMTYGDGEPPNSIFAELVVKMAAYRKA
ncbi:MAG: hypothetical protein NT169_15280 [Chloroflexi bacterium]|nr:hypothetical protein [Chloroflexota bacterium]